MKTKTEKSLREVWQMKRAAYEETKNLKGDAYFEHVHRTVVATFPGLATLKRRYYEAAGETTPLLVTVPCVADGHGEYRAGNKKRKRAGVTTSAPV